ncbi:MAG: hypothetical protein DHS20C18_27570 [Saprospiraceae bacterium]|nr:MAG: hypothetical protein DHS20C18_27570 [Saprospiraceae bacterium]
MGCFFSDANELGKDQILPKKIKDTYIAVLPFKNNTGKADLSVIGEMAADWITSGLHEAGEGKILSVGEVNRVIERAKLQKDSVDQSISQQEGVHYLIEGTYYKVEEELLFSSTIKDVENGEIVFSFPVISGTEQDPLAAIEILKQRILGYWVTKDRAGYERRPPVYEAYQAYLEAGKIWYFNPEKAGRLLEKAIELDSNFHYAVIGYAHNLLNTGKAEKADSIIESFHQKKEQLNRMELELFNELNARISRNFDQLWNGWQSPYMAAYWGKTHVINQKASSLLYNYNQPQMVLDLFKDIDFSRLDYNEDTPTRSMYFKKIEAFFHLGRYEEVKEMLMNPPFEIQRLSFIAKKVFLLANMKAYDELDLALDYHIKTTPLEFAPAHYLRAFAILGLLATDDREKASAIAHTYLQFLETASNDFIPRPIKNSPGITIQEAKVHCYLALNEPEKAKPLFEKGVGLDESQADILTLKGIFYAQMNDEAAARDVMNQLNQRREKFDFGTTEIGMAAIEAWLGNDDIAISLLVESRLKGSRVSFLKYDTDWKLKPLFNHPDFKNKVLAPFPLPTLESSSNEHFIASISPWPFIFGAIILGLGFYLFLRNRQSKREKHQIPASENITTPTADSEDAFLIQLKEVIEANRSNTDFNLPQLCKAMGVSRAQIYRKIKELTGKSPSIYVRSLRLQKAMELLESTDLNISEIAFEVGFKDLSYFSRSFSEEFGFSPSETRK